jgi:hydroxymethylpyrimidine pyrophosphatase-like HAD family hydrolase
MRYLALATDFDGTLARDGVAAPAALDVIARMRETGRKAVLVTGRVLDDLRETFDEIDAFDRVVAENGAVLLDPSSRATRRLADPPPPAFLERLREAGVDPLIAGEVVVATREPYETTALETIKELGLELRVVFNKGAVMILPASVNKATGLDEALAELGLSAHNVVGIGDAENDHAFLDACDVAVAVVNALPAVMERVDEVTRDGWGEGVAELVERLLEVQNLALFVQIADGLDDETWLYHLRVGDYSAWFRDAIKDAELAEEAAAIERDPADRADESRERIRRAIDARYTLPA